MDFVETFQALLVFNNMVSPHIHKCQQCDKIYRNETKLGIHINTAHTKEIAYPCEFPTCGRVFTKKTLLLKHSLRHDPDSKINTLVPCPICKAKYKKINLSAHVARQHRLPKNKECDTCHRMFSNNQALNKHKNTHLSEAERPIFPCTFCEKKFLVNSCLRNHIHLIHSGNQKSYPCALCSKEFKQSDQLLDHMRTHTGKCRIVVMNVIFLLSPGMGSITTKGYIMVKYINLNVSNVQRHLSPRVSSRLIAWFTQMTGTTNVIPATRLLKQDKN